jgi:hypothetical protein
MHKTRFVWTADALAVLRQRYASERTADIATALGLSCSCVYNKAHSTGLRKSPAFLSSEASGRLRIAGHQGVLHRFKPGHRTWNTGFKGWSAAGTEATRFLPGSTPVNRQQVGALRINSDGQIDIKLYDGLRAWVQLHHYAWFLAHGEWPARGMCIRFRDGDSHNPAAENMYLITRRENMRLNSVHTIYPPEVARLIQLRGALKRQINRRARALTPEASQ